MKHCSKCGTDKQLDQFGTDKNRAGGKALYCRTCVAELMKISRKRNNAHRTEYNRQYREKNRAAFNAWEREHYVKRKNTVSNQAKIWRETRSGSIRMLHLSTRNRAKKKGREYKLSPEIINCIMEIQKNRCALTDIEFELTSDGDHRYRPFAPSIDRKDNSGGYTIENIQIVCCIVNKARNEYPVELFDAMCRARVVKLDGKT